MLDKEIIFYTDNQLEPKLAKQVQDNLRKIADDKKIPIVCSSLRSMSFGNKNIWFPSLRRGNLTMFRQIYAALEHTTATWIFFCEHDVLYHPSHFDFTPPTTRHYYYNDYFYKFAVGDTTALRHYCTQTSGLCAHRKILLRHYKRRIEICENYRKEIIEQDIAAGRTPNLNYDGFKKSIGYEPGKHMMKGRVDTITGTTWRSEFPNVDIRHGNNLTAGFWHLQDYRNKMWLPGYLISDEVPGWGKVKEILK